MSLLVVISADRGLCGAFNTNLVRRAAQLLRERAAEDVRLLFIGKKAWEYFRRRSWPIAGLHRDLGGQLDLVRAQTITDELLDRFLSGEVREVNLLYTRFLSTLVRRVTLDPFLPIEPEAAGGETGFARSAAGAGAATGAGAPTGAGAATGAGAPTGAGAATGAGAPRPAEAAAVSRRRAQEVEYIFEPSPEGIFETLLPRYALTRVMAALLESFAAEHAARMVAMGSASRNAEEMIDNLILLRNRIRQAGITKEIAELVGGAEALR